MRRFMLPVLVFSVILLTNLYIIPYTNVYGLYVPFSGSFNTNINAQCDATIVTAYYKMKSKHSLEEYESWMGNMLSLQDCMVIFTAPDTVDLIQSHRVNYPQTVIIPLELNQTMAYNLLTEEEWSQQEHIDKETNIGHNKFLYSVWHQKPDFVKTAADRNYFQSQYFVWVDIGSLRSKELNNRTLIQTIPSERGILLLSMTDFTQEEKTLVNGKSLADFTHSVRLSGNCQGFDQQSVYDWHSKYFSVFKDYLQRGLFVGKDQNLMATSCLESDLCLLFKSNGDWFQLQKYLTGFHPNRTYHRLKIN